jgi:hypothetical protein
VLIVECIQRPHLPQERDHISIEASGFSDGSGPTESPSVRYLDSAYRRKLSTIQGPVLRSQRKWRAANLLKQRVQPITFSNGNPVTDEKALFENRRVWAPSLDGIAGFARNRLAVKRYVGSSGPAF